MGRGTWVAALPLLRACNARHARCILDRFTHSLLTSGLPRITRSAVANQCGALAVGRGIANADCRAPRSFEHNSRRVRMLHIGSFHALSSHEWLGSHSSLGSSQSVRLNCAKENVSRRGPARSSLRRRHARCILNWTVPLTRFPQVACPLQLVVAALLSRCGRGIH